jgi:C4-dicarboxylate-specific signal transduction histidine kinase
VVLTDIKMPSESGFSLLQKIRKIDANLPVIFITGHGDKKMAIDAIRAGAFDFIEKPFETEEIINAVQNAFNFRDLKIKNLFISSNLQQKMNEITHLTKELTSSRALMDKSTKINEVISTSGEVIHEVINPITIIEASIDSILRELNEKQVSLERLQTLAPKIKKMTVRIIDIIDKIKNANEGYLSQPLPKVNISEVIKDSLLLVEKKINQSDVTIEFVELPSEIFITCWPIQLSQVLVNLLNNACDAIKNLESRWVRFEIDYSDSAFVNMSIIDSGAGIPVEIRNRIFESFFTTKKNTGGTGLGLSICKKIMENLGGGLQLDENNNIVEN